MRTTGDAGGAVAPWLRHRYLLHRALEQASYDSIAVRYATTNTHPDHDTISSFRKRFLKQIEAILVQVLCYAQATKISMQFGVGNISRNESAAAC